MKLFRRPQTKERRKGSRRATDAVSELVNEFQAVILFEPSGKIIHANENFLAAMGYERDEIVGKHHRIFVKPDYANTPEYEQFWERLRAGEAFSDRFVRLKKGGEEIWIQATYAASRDETGEIKRVCKVAVDVTDHVYAERVVQALKEGLTDLGNGNLTKRIDASGSNAELAHLFNSAVEQIGSMLARSQEVGSSVAEAADRLESSSMSLTRQSENQAAAVEETSAAVRGLTDTARQRAEQVAEMEGDAQRTLADRAKRPGCGRQGHSGHGPVGERTRLRSPISSLSSMISPFRPACWRSMPVLRLRVPVMPGAGLRSWRRRCERSRIAPPRARARSRR